ncbi:unnamed protein product [Rhodiola kirilowii]
MREIVEAVSSRSRRQIITKQVKQEEREEEEDEDDQKYVVDALHERLKSSRESRFDLLRTDLGLESSQRKYSREAIVNGIRDLSDGLVINPDNRWYKLWTKFILVWAIYSTFFTPMEFGFFRGLPKHLKLLDIASQLFFLVDIVMQFLVAYRDNQTYLMVYQRRHIAMRYVKSTFVVDLLGCMPWDIIYKACGHKEVIRYFLWLRLVRLRKVEVFLQDMEKDIRINYLFTRIVKLIVVELYCTHTAACIFYYLATTLPPEQEGYTWIGSLKMGDYSYSHFRDIDIWTRYITSLYFAIVTMATVGYGDIHAVNLREMIFIMIYVSFDMILGAYLIGNMTALIVKGSNTERFRDKMTDVMKYMNRNRLGKDIRSQIKGHLRLQYEANYTDSAVLQDIPVSIRAKISQTLYKTLVERVPLFKGCSPELINQVVIKVHEEFFLPGELIMEQGHVVDQIYFVCHGSLDVVVTSEDGSKEIVSTLQPESSFGEISILCNIPHPYTVRVHELCRLLRLDKQSFMNILDIYFFDGRKIYNNILQQEKDVHMRVKQVEYDITFHIGKQEADLALKVNNAAYFGDLNQVQSLIRAGADPNKPDYDGRTPLHIASSRGYEEIVLFLIQEGTDVDLPDKFGNTPLFEAIKNRHDGVASLLVKEGASLKFDDAGGFLCTAVSKGHDSDFVKRILGFGVDPNSKNYDHRTPLHVAASMGLLLMAKLLVEAGASVFLKDRWGHTPLDEAKICGNKSLLKLLEDAKSSESTNYSEEIIEKIYPIKCTVFPFHPWDPKEEKRNGIVLRIPHSIQALIQEAADHLNCSSDAQLFVLSEDAGKIIDVDLIRDGQKLYLVSEMGTQIHRSKSPNY